MAERAHGSTVGVPIWVCVCGRDQQSRDKSDLTSSVTSSYFISVSLWGFLAQVRTKLDEVDMFRQLTGTCAVCINGSFQREHVITAFIAACILHILNPLLGIQVMGMHHISDEYRYTLSCQDPLDEKNPLNGSLIYIYLYIYYLLSSHCRFRRMVSERLTVWRSGASTVGLYAGRQSGDGDGVPVDKRERGPLALALSLSLSLPGPNPAEFPLNMLLTNSYRQASSHLNRLSCVVHPLALCTAHCPLIHPCRAPPVSFTSWAVSRLPSLPLAGIGSS